MENQELNNNTYCIYCHTSPSGKRYIGQTGIKPEKRWNNGRGYENGTYIRNAINEYGWENFTHEILEENLTLDEANEREAYWINYYNTIDHTKGYNLREGGNNSKLSQETIDKRTATIKSSGCLNGENNPMFGRPHTEAEKKQISESLLNYYSDPEHHGYWFQKESPNKGKSLSDEAKQKVSIANTGKLVGENNPNFGSGTNHWTKDSAEKYAQTMQEKREAGWIDPRIGKPLSDDHKQAISKSLLGREFTDEWRKHMSESSPFKRKILCLDNMEIFESITEAATALGLDRSKISMVCSGKRKQTGGYHFKYYEKQEVVA